MNILYEIAERTQARIDEKKKSVSMEEIKETAECRDKKAWFPFEDALRGEGISFICEVKKASPSKGVIAEEFPYMSIAKEYEAAGAAAVSVLTEPFYFQGSDRHLREISEIVTVPLLRKDFVTDSYMIYEAKCLGASAVLLICAILDQGKLCEYIETAHGLGLSALVETHDERDVESALSAGARIIGVNNRDLKTFEVDMCTSERLRPLVPEDKIFVSESGIKTPLEVERLRNIRGSAALVGESLMRATDKKAALGALMGVPHE